MGSVQIDPDRIAFVQQTLDGGLSFADSSLCYMKLVIQISQGLAGRAAGGRRVAESTRLRGSLHHLQGSDKNYNLRA